MQHSILAPSSASRWIKCPGSVQYPQDDRETDASREGTAAHRFAERWLISGAPPADMPDYMAEPLAVYIAAVLSVTTNPAVEQRLQMPLIHPACFGTADATHRGGRRVFVFDLKFGRMPVEVENNYQLICYAIGAARPGDVVTVYIVQPRIWHPDGPIRSVTYSYDELTEHAARLHKQAVIALSENAYTSPGYHCQWCPGLHVCPAARRVSLQDRPQVLEIPDSTLADELQILRESLAVTQNRLDALERDALGRLRTGARLIGCNAHYSEGRRSWNTPDEDVIKMSDLLNINITKLITPAQALNCGIPEEIINQYSNRKTGKLKISTDGDEIAKRVFKNVE